MRGPRAAAWTMAFWTAATVAGAQPYPCQGPSCLSVGEEGWVVGEVRTMAFGAESKKVMEELARRGWVECAGQAFSRLQYPRLYQVLGDTWGSADGATSFYLPDLRGAFLRGWTHGRPAAAAIGPGAFEGRDPDAERRLPPRGEIPAPGKKGHEGDAVGSVQVHEVSRHNHPPDQQIGRNNGWSSGWHTENAQKVVSGPGDAAFRNADFGGAETRPNNVSLMFLIYVGRASMAVEGSPEKKTGEIVPFAAKQKVP